jgi:hypothetical protein
MTASRIPWARLELTLRPPKCYAGTIDSDGKGRHERLRRVECRWGLLKGRATHWTRNIVVPSVLLCANPLPETLAMKCMITRCGFCFAIIECVVTYRTIHCTC